MSKRFTETCKWDDPWFRSLPGSHKLVFLYIVDRCNNAGFWEVDEGAMAFQTQLKTDHISGAIKGLTRGLLGADGWVWVKNFLRHQKNSELNPSNNAHRQIIELIKQQVERFSDIPEFQDFLAPYKGLISPIGTGKGKGEEGMQGETFTPPTLQQVLAIAANRSVPPDCAQSFFDSMESTGWIDAQKRPIRKWRNF